MTSLIDVIFLLLLFFMLSSTFTRFAEVELAAAGAGAGLSDARPVFLRLTPGTLTVNGTENTLADLPATLDTQRQEGADLPVLVSLGGEVTSQRLTDLLVALRAVPGLQVTVLGAA
ncbi:hypothetical protein OB2597_05440 [Pseudooceanicola batsensis HTCC2597]|uniref:Biopolymer transport protein ExbD/TolR n=2 Tax=Pseudooceanicola batsensis TaxID=314255 RepID=A3TSS3_PSEBH|nr:hypothetical protein OB2597_05440 [Pseudooceanicola batsensis HTCC2597]